MGFPSRAFKNMKYNFNRTVNLCYVLNKDDEVLLIYKKRGFGTDKWNGPGGKVKDGEDVEQSAIREVAEETGIKPLNLRNMGFIEFIWKNKEDWNQKCYLYLTKEFGGKITESDECLPKWFKINEIPFDKMWEDDKYWLLDLLSGKEIYKRFFFDKDNKIADFENI